MSQPLISPEEFDVTAPPFWHKHVDGLQKALDEGGNTHSLDDVKHAIFVQDAQWHGFEDCAFVTEILDFPQKKVGRVWLLTGALPAIQARVPPLRQWFENQGCAEVLVVSREGWPRAIPGLTPRYTVCTMELNP